MKTVKFCEYYGAWVSFVDGHYVRDRKNRVKVSSTKEEAEKVVNASKMNPNKALWRK